MAGWEEPPPPRQQQHQQQESAALPLPAAATAKSSFRSSWAFERAVRNFTSTVVDAELLASMKNSLLNVAKRRGDAHPFWTYQDVSIIAPGKYVRPQQDGPVVSFEHNKLPTLYICLFLRIAGCKDSKALKRVLQLCEAQLAREYGKGLDLELGNGLMVLLQLGVIDRRAL